MASPGGSVSSRDSIQGGDGLRKIHLKCQSPSDYVPLMGTAKGMGVRLQGLDWIRGSVSKREVGVPVCGWADGWSLYSSTTNKISVLTHEAWGGRTEVGPPGVAIPRTVTPGSIRTWFSVGSNLLAVRTLEAFFTPTVTAGVGSSAGTGSTCRDSVHGAQSGN